MTFGETRRQLREWKKLYGLIRDVLAPYGKDDPFGKGDYWVLEDNYGFNGHKILVNRLHILKPEIVHALQTLLHEFPDWHIVIALALRGTQRLPDMGLTLTASGIKDDLDRSFLPAEIKAYRYER